MAQVIVTESSLQNIAGAIRSKLGTQDTYKPSEMAGAIAQIHGDPVLEALNVNANGTYTPSSGKDGFSQAVVNVPNTYASGDEGKVVSGGALVAQSSQSITQNGTYDTTLKNQAIVNVPNSYSASDEGKVVDNGALVAQSSQSITENGTYDTTLKNQVIVNVSGGGGSGVILSGTESPTSVIGENENLYVKYVVEPSTFDHSIGIDSIYRKVNGVWVDYTEPSLPTKGVHIWTKSTGGYDAAMYVQNGYWDVDNNQFVATGEIESVIYTSVQTTTYDCNGIATLQYAGSWVNKATTNVTDGTNQYASGQTIKTWTYGATVDFYVWKNA